MEMPQTHSLSEGWSQGWMVLRVKLEPPGDFVSFHAHAAEAQADARQRGAGHQVFHGSYRAGTGEFIVD